MFSYFKGNDEKAGEMMSYLKRHVNVYRMCYLPAHAAMICFLYDKQDSYNVLEFCKIYYSMVLLVMLILVHSSDS